MPAVETTGSISAKGYGLNSGSDLATIAINGVYSNLTYAYNGTGLTISRGPWAYYCNLPQFLIGTVTTTNINDGNAVLTFTTDKSVKVYLMRDQPWSEVDLSGWQTVVPYASGNQFIDGTGINPYTNMGIFSRVFSAGTHTLDNLSAMYFWENAQIAPEQTPLQPAIINQYYYDLTKNRPFRTFYSGTTWNNLTSGEANATFNNLTVGNDTKSIVFNGATSATEGTIVDAANPTTQLSLDFWIKPTANNIGWVRLFGKDPYSSGWLVFFESGGNVNGTGSRIIRMLGVTNTGEQRLTPSVQVALNQWSHIVCTWEVGNTTSGLKIYINGNLIGSNPLTGTSFVTSSSPIKIGGVQGGEHFAGEIGSLRIYKGLLLSQREISESYANGLLHKYGPQFTGRKAVISPSISGNSIWDFDSQGAISLGTQQENAQYIIPLTNFTVNAKIWGAGGGARAGAAGAGGGGGYTNVSSLPFTKGNCYTLTVGAFGKKVPDNTNPSPAYPVGPGGGGQAPGLGFTGQGGGYSAIFTKGTAAACTLAIAGGGGSMGVDASTPGGAGGGVAAQNGTGTNAGTGATSTGPGVNGLSNPSGSVVPGRLQGGSAGIAGDDGGGGGGGGGWYGGGAGYNGDSPPGNSGGGGGSGYVSPILTGTTATGSGAVPANDNDLNRQSSGNGANRSGIVDATDGRVYIA